ncbi:hypothetical protein [Deinococcus cellulosilyticus]|uniref:Uncharacterized protein n=1 Tax=Deinococcus cellulosilyticus (strain DSM 18568 / NBRC 106333 / KACC 11606 / 5516J-15) TaxID=1223518 RepID=A0A511MW53_DEIC1|nr:hypothetical protein [Deinococcus cellulosilyticus]GEM44631.1 hypothetical protein DC3_02660 [Deinococcus cellulosilyticus NBRC 106333 = KACC 11606]
MTTSREPVNSTQQHIEQAIHRLETALNGLQNGWDMNHHLKVQEQVAAAHRMLSQISGDAALPPPSPLQVNTPFRFRRACIRKIREVLDTLSIEEVRGNPFLVGMCVESLAETYQLMN